MMTAQLLADSNDYAESIASIGPFGGLGGYLIAALILIPILGKAGERPWAGFVPFYNLYVYTRMAGYTPWAFLLYVIPLVNIVFSLLVVFRVGRAFGHGGLFSFFLLWLPGLAIIGHLVIGLSSDTYDRSRIPA
jgi:hypothetical protein